MSWQLLFFVAQTTALPILKLVAPTTAVLTLGLAAPTTAVPIAETVVPTIHQRRLRVLWARLEPNARMTDLGTRREYRVGLIRSNSIQQGLGDL